MRKRLTIEEIEKRIFEKHGDTVTLNVSSYKNTYTKALFSDCEFG